LRMPKRKKTEAIKKKREERCRGAIQTTGVRAFILRVLRDRAKKCEEKKKKF